MPIKWDKCWRKKSKNMLIKGTIVETDIKRPVIVDCYKTLYNQQGYKVLIPKGTKYDKGDAYTFDSIKLSVKPYCITSIKYSGCRKCKFLRKKMKK